MKKSIHKLITFTVITFIITLFASMTPTLAKELTLQQLGRAIEKQDAKNKVESSYAYIIGKYVFTSNIEHFTTQDVMLAARSISNITGDDGEIDSDPIYDKMAIQLIERTYGSDGITATGWKISSNLIGGTKLDEKKIDVTYIDYNYIKDEVTVDTDSLVNESMKTLKKDLFTADTANVKDGKITVKVNKVKESIYKGMNSGVLASLSSLVAKDGVKSVDFAYTNAKGEKVTTTVGKTINIEEIVNWFDENAETIFGKKLEDLKTYDLVGKQFTVTINLDEDKEKSYVSSKNLLESETYTINFTGEKETVNTDELVKKAMEKLSAKDVFTLSELKDGTVTATVKDVDTKIATGMNSGIIDALIELMKNADIASITFGYKDANVQAFELTKETEYDDILTWYEKNAELIFGKKDINDLTMNDIINKEFTVTINLQDYAQKEDANPTQYTVKIEATKYTVTFDYNGADNPKDETTVSIEDGKTVTKPDDPTREGYIFEGWYDESSSKDQKFEFTTRIKKNTELKAHWKLDIKEADYILDASKEDNGTFESEYNTDTSTVTVTITDPTGDLEDLGLAEDIKALVEKEGVKSVAMTYNGDTITFTSEIANLEEEINNFLNKVISEEMTARTKREVSDNNLKNLDEKEIDVKVVIKPELDNEAGETEVIDYKIKFEILTHTVTFNYDDDNKQPKTVTVDNKGKVEKTEDLENPTRDGYRFDGWYNGPAKFTFDEEITEDTVLNAKWIKQYTVTFDYNDSGEEQKTVIVDENTTIDNHSSYDPKPRDGYRFDGWYDEDQNKIDLNDPVTKNLTLKARWTVVLTDAEKQKLDVLSKDALSGIDTSVIEVNVDNEKHTITVKISDKTRKLYTMLAGRGLREALHKYLKDELIKSIELYLNGDKKATVTADMVKDTGAMLDSVDQFLLPFQEATGKDNPMEMTFQDLILMEGEIKVKIILENDKSFEDEADSEYTFVFTSN